MPRPSSLPLRLLLVALSLLALAPLSAQETGAKKPLSLEDYDRWRTVISTEISNDGEWMTYAYGHRVGEDTLQVRELDGEELFLIPGGKDPLFSDDSRWLAYQSSEGAGLLDLRTGEKKEWKNAAQFRFAEGSGHLAILKKPGDSEAAHTGAGLILKDLSTGGETLLGNTASFAFNKGGSHLGYLVDAGEKAGNGLYLLRLSSGAMEVLDSDTLRYSRLSWNSDGSALAALKGETPEGATERVNSLVAFRGLLEGSKESFSYQATGENGLPEGFVLSEKGAVSWREDGSLVFVGIDEQGVAVEEDPENPRPNVDVFHWKDDRIQSVQRNQAARDRRFTLLSAVDLDSGRMVTLADSSMRTVTLSKDGRLGIGRDDRAYISDWKERQADYYLVDTKTGERAQILEGQKRTLGLSPDGRHFGYWKDGHVWVHNLEEGTKLNLTESAPVSFIDQEYDHPGTKPPYGLAGWSKDGTAILLYHSYDLWLQPLDGSPATNLTRGVGAQNQIRFRYLRTDPEEEAIDLEEPLLLSAYGEWTKKSGFYELDGERLRERVFEDRRYAELKKAKDTEKVIFRASTFSEFPDYWVSDLDFDDPERVTSANPHQSEYSWGRRILVDFQNKSGVPLQATLAIPDGYQEGQKLPMIVNFYEKKSQDMHAYYAPVFGASYPSGNMGPVAEFAAYVSNGYLVLQPDIHLNTGTTHSDMLDCVTAAVRRVIELGYADPDRIALGGGSFSGGGSAFISTQTDQFAAIVARAAPINLAGEFNILFSGSGQNNHSYDIYGQGRYGTNPFDDPDLYREQSPITHVQTMNTPLLYLHGVQDGSVEYLQGMEFYNALRFLEKPIIFLSYPDEGHNLKKYENQIDFTKRLWQFLDHYLKDAPAPRWMTEGVPFLRR
jgi:dipeptidyl aminopeptidase/acylaminoacyl peptidase